MRHVNAAQAIPLQERIPTSQHCVMGTAYNARKRTKPQTQLSVAGTKLVDNLILNVSPGEHVRGRGNRAEALPKVSASLLVGR
jgi:hypothetical protein